MPYFEGDFWPNVLEESIKELDQEAEEKRKAEASAAAAAEAAARAAAAASDANGEGEDSTDVSNFFFLHYFIITTYLLKEHRHNYLYPLRINNVFESGVTKIKKLFIHSGTKKKKKKVHLENFDFCLNFHHFYF